MKINLDFKIVPFRYSPQSQRFFSLAQKELPAVAFLSQEKIAFLPSGLPLQSGAEHILLKKR
jgi:hypothetical protein